MSLDEVFKRAVEASSKGHDKRKFTLLVGTVKSIDGDTCTVNDYEDVRLNAIIDNLQSQFTVYPKVGSKVIIGRLEGEDDAFIVKCSEIDKVTAKIGDQLFEMANGKFVIQAGGVNFKQVLNDILNRFQQAIITTPSGPGAFSTTDIQAFAQYNEQINTLFSDGT
jgi:hypothetical protein